MYSRSQRPLTFPRNNKNKVEIIVKNKNIKKLSNPTIRIRQAFSNPGHNFNAHAKFFITEEVYNKSLSKLKISSLLEHRDEFWILKLQTSSPQGVNTSLNYPQDTTGFIW